MTSLRRLLNVIVIAIVVLIVVLVSIVKFVDPNRIKPFITAEVKKQTGYQLVIDGNFTWSFYPRLGIKAEGMTLTAPKETKPFITMQNVTLGMDFLQLLRGKRNLSGDVHAKQLTLMNLQARNLNADVQWENNILTISPVSAELYEGWMAGTMHARNLSKIPEFDWDVQFTRVELQPLLQDLNGKSIKLEVGGVGQLRMEAETSGMNKEALIKHLQGTMNYNLSNGFVTGIDLNYLIDSAVQIINKKPISPPPAGKMQTSFESLTGTMKIKRGVTTTEDTVLVSSVFTVKSAGSIDLTRQFLDYSLEILPQNLEQLKWGIPVLVSGYLQDPTVKLDMLKINTIIANEEFQRLKDKAKEKLKDVPKDVEKFLGKIFNGDE